MFIGKLPFLTFCPLLLVAEFISFSSWSQAAVSLQILEYPREVKIEAPFTLSASISGLPAGQSFRYKVGLANTGGSYYGYGEVKSGDNWIGYNDPDSCNQAPQTSSNDQGHWEGTINAKIRLGAKTGTGQLRIRICDPSKTSGNYEINLLEADKPPEPEPKEEEKKEETTVNTQNDSPETPPTDEVAVTTVVDDEEPSPPPQPQILAFKTSVKTPDYKLPATLSAILYDPKRSASVEASSTGQEVATESDSSRKFPPLYVIIGGSVVTVAILTGIAFLLKKKFIDVTF